VSDGYVVDDDEGLACSTGNRSRQGVSNFAVDVEICIRVSSCQGWIYIDNGEQIIYKTMLRGSIVGYLSRYVHLELIASDGVLPS
jgi:hypothetical protein